MKLAAATLAFLLGADAAFAQGRPLTQAEIEQRVEALFEEWDRADTPGCALGVARAGQTVLSRAWGMADLERAVRNTPETIFEAGSVAKQFTAAAVLLLAQSGRLSLDEPVRKYFKELPDYGAPLTIRQLLHHTSGLRDWGAVAGIAGWPRGTRAHTQEHVLDIVKRQRALNFPPGTEHSYSNTGYNLAAMLVGRVADDPLAAFTSKHIFDVLEMRRSSWRDDHARIVKDRAQAYAALSLFKEYALDMPFEDAHGNGGLLTTTEDLLRWNENFVHARVGGTDLVRELQRKGTLADGTEIGYARGLYVTQHQGIPEVSHSGSTAGYRAFLARYPEQHLSVALLCNAGDADTRVLAHEVAELYLGLTRPVGDFVAVRAPGPPPRAALDPGLLSSKAGLYRHVRSGEPLALDYDAGVLRIHKGPSLIPVNKTRFRRPNAGFVDFEIGVDGLPRRVFTTSLTDDVAEYEPVERVRPTLEQLQELVGEYASEEAEVTLRVAIGKGALLVQRRPASVFTLGPLYRDAWDATFGMVRFRRDGNRRVVGLSVTVPRVRDMPFRRVE
jgi:CubicO group peptidase (beta-lactamase class C family)